MYSWYPVSIGPPSTVAVSSLFVNSFLSGNERLDTKSMNVGRASASGCLPHTLNMYIIIQLLHNIHIPALHHSFIYGPGTAGRGRKTETQTNHPHTLKGIITTCGWVCLFKCIPLDWCIFQMVCVPDSISHTGLHQSSTHH